MTKARKAWITRATAITLALFFGITGAALAVESPIDDSNDDLVVTCTSDILSLEATFNNWGNDDLTDDEIIVTMTLCGLDDKTKYQVRFDTPLHWEAQVNKEGIVPDPSCPEPADFGMTHRAKRNTGPGMIEVNEITATLRYIVLLSELGLTVGDTVHIWAVTQNKEQQDRVPDTFTADGCAEPSDISEVMELSLVAQWPQSKRVFVSSVAYNGSLGGLAGADAKCQVLADTAGLQGSYKAWLSSATEAAKSRMTHSTAPYVKYDDVYQNTVTVANDFTDLTDGTLIQPIDTDESGNFVTTFNVWTNTEPTGDIHTTNLFDNCNNWTSTVLQHFPCNGYIGLSYDVYQYWTMSPEALTCTDEARLFCVEQ